MNIGARAAMSKVTRMGWPNLGVGMAKCGPNWPQLELTALSYTPYDPHEFTGALSNANPANNGR